MQTSMAYAQNLYLSFSDDISKLRICSLRRKPWASFWPQCHFCWICKTQNCCHHGCVWTPVTYTHEDACYMCMSLRQPHHNKLVLFVTAKLTCNVCCDLNWLFTVTVNTDFHRKLKKHHKSLFNYRYLGHCCWWSCPFCHRFIIRYFTQMSQAVSPWKCWHVICDAPLYLSSIKSPIQTLATSLRQHLDLILTHRSTHLPLSIRKSTDSPAGAHKNLLLPRIEKVICL